jgi:hypothetical protein
LQVPPPTIHRLGVKGYNVLRERFPDQNFSKFKVKRVVNLFEDTGSVRETKRICTKSVTENEEPVAAVINSVTENPEISIKIWQDN